MIDRYWQCLHLHLHLVIPQMFTKATYNEDNGSNQNQQKSNDMQVLWQVISLTQYTWDVC